MSGVDDAGPERQELGEYRGPTLEMYGIGTIVALMVTEDQIDALDTLVAEENKHLGFMSLMLGVFLSTVISWATASQPTPVARAAYPLATVGFGILSLFFAMGWNEARRKRPRLIEKIRAKAVRVKMSLADRPS